MSLNLPTLVRDSLNSLRENLLNQAAYALARQDSITAEEVRQKGGDPNNPATAADEEIETSLCGNIAPVFRSAKIHGEEFGDRPPLDGTENPEILFMFDPIDGTSNWSKNVKYLRGEKPKSDCNWGLMGACFRILSDGTLEPLASVVVYPMLTTEGSLSLTEGSMIFASKDGGTWHQRVVLDENAKTFVVPEGSKPTQLVLNDALNGPVTLGGVYDDGRKPPIEGQVPYHHPDGRIFVSRIPSAGLASVEALANAHLPISGSSGSACIAILGMLVKSDKQSHSYVHSGYSGVHDGSIPALLVAEAGGVARVATYDKNGKVMSSACYAPSTDAMQSLTEVLPPKSLQGTVLLDTGGRSRGID